MTNFKSPCWLTPTENSKGQRQNSKGQRQHPCTPNICQWFQLWPWPLNSKIKRIHPHTKANMSAKFDEEAHNVLVFIVFTSLFQYTSNLLPWPLTSKIDWIRPLIMVNTSAKFDEEWFSLYHIHKVRAWHRHAPTKPQRCYYIPFATCCVGIKKIPLYWLIEFKN